LEAIIQKVAMKNSKSSQRWLDEHFSDNFVKQAKQDGLRSRAAYKLRQIQEKYQLIKPGDTVVDLGAAPGGWCQVARDWLGQSGVLFALDILPMDKLADVTFIQGDFTQPQVLEALESNLKGQMVDVVLSDMAPNMSGHKAVDQPKSIYLVELALEFAQENLRVGGSFLVKVFHGEGFEQYYKELKQAFKKVTTVKPKASRDRSKEVYLLALDKCK